MTSKIIVALDFEKEAEALALVDQIDPSLCRLKKCLLHLVLIL